MSILRYMLAALVLVLLNACTTLGPTAREEGSAVAANDVVELPTGSCGVALPPTATEADAIRGLLEAEGTLVVAQDIAALMRLWSDDGVITDAKNTPDDPTDDQAWIGKDAIRHRYVRIVFPGAPVAAQPADLNISIRDDHASITATTQIGSEVSPLGDHWQLVRRDQCWLIQSLTYNLEVVK